MKTALPLPSFPQFEGYRHSKETLLKLYRAILLPRLIEEKMLSLLRQGRISKWFSGIGQEAISAGAALAMRDDEYILTLHRNLGVFTSRKVPLVPLFAQLQGKQEGFTGGRERSFHFGLKEHRIVGMISHLGPQLAVAGGIALAHALSKEKKAVLAFTGEGGTSEGDFHEAVNVAAVWDLPVIFLIENNAYALSTPVNEQYRCEKLIDKAKGYGIEGVRIDGNNILEVYDTVSTLAASIRKKPRPVLLECMTFRMRGHEEASGTKYVPKKLLAEWEKKDPVACYEQHLLLKKALGKKDAEAIRARFKNEIAGAVEKALAGPPPVPDTESELKSIYAPFQSTSPVLGEAGGKTTKKRFVDALSDGMREAMKKHKNLVLMGQDIAEYGGVFKATEGFVQEFGRERVRNTPLCESAILGAGLGLSVKGYKSVIEMQFSDFVTSGFNQVVNNLAKIHWRWGQNADVVVRMPTGAGVGAGPFHSQSTEAWFFHVPGLKIVYPSTPAEAKGLLLAAIEDPNPVLFFEHKYLYRSISEEVPDGYYVTPIGKARTVREGNEVTVITYGWGVHKALETLAGMPEISADVVDLRTLLPFDREAIAQSVKKTGRVIILHEDTLTGGIGAEISAFITENLFEYLDAPVMRCAGLDSPVPFAPELEKNFLPWGRFREKLAELLRY